MTRVRPWTLVLVVASVTACAPFSRAQGPEAARGAKAAAARAAAIKALRASIDTAINAPKFRSAMWGALIVDPEHGDTLYSHNAAKLFLPASNEKVITAAVALATLGPDFRFTTRVAYSGSLRDTMIAGDLVVFGSGDPSFSDRVSGDAMIPLYGMADSIRARGIRRIDGRLRRGKPVFTDVPIGFGWAWDDLAQSYGATVGDLMFNDAFTPVHIAIDGLPDTSRTPAPRYKHFLDAFNAAMYERGVNVFLGYDWLTPVPDSGLTTLFTYQSPPLSDLLRHFTKPSQNQIGEILLKTLGLTQTGAGRADSGAAVVARKLVSWGADSAGFVVRDGSGLSRHDYVSPETIVRVLEAVRRDSTFGIFYNALPIGGTDGTLERRFQSTATAGNVHAKTGSMDRVRSLSGYVTTADGHLLEFAIFANGWTTTGTEVESSIDAIVARLANLHLGR
ncbi:MAG TPA: D-alanyl-D-alanine carboxypeptidase/D-alanyl-D-alanine-endopeptidase [Gemmatimonadaceae bacterium]|nr:D-alanyl-D-alanine carboxypeptidase/D-alanyl-D-alanine-endopeptidase [Gemmatimonadaceae bacterium]